MAQVLRDALLLGNRSFLGRLFRPTFNLIRCSWHMDHLQRVSPSSLRQTMS
jgi:high-affinity nickel permease